MPMLIRLFLASICDDSRAVVVKRNCNATKYSRGKTGGYNRFLEYREDQRSECARYLHERRSGSAIRHNLYTEV